MLAKTTLQLWILPLARMFLRHLELKWIDNRWLLVRNQRLPHRVSRPKQLVVTIPDEAEARPIVQCFLANEAFQVLRVVHE